MRQRLRNYWHNTSWHMRWQALIVLLFMVFVLSLELMRRFIPAWAVGFALPRWLAPTRLRVGLLALTCLADTYLMELARSDWAVYLSIGWIFLCLGYFEGAHFWTMSQEPPPVSSHGPADSSPAGTSEA